MNLKSYDMGRKLKYLPPKVEIIDLEADRIIAVSSSYNIGDDEYNGAARSKRKAFWMNDNKE